MRKVSTVAILCLTAAFGPVAMVSGCGAAGSVESGPEPVAQDGAFLAVERPLSDKATSLRPAALPGTRASSFYLAIRKRELGQKWFLSAYAKDIYPGAISGGAARSLGVKVVTFRVQNGKLFVFDASDGIATSDTFDPTLIVEAYPLVEDSKFLSNADASEYVLFDPAAGLNRFGLLADAFAPVGAPGIAHVQVDLSFMQNFRTVADGVTFEQVFTGGSTDMPISEEGNAFKISGTLGIALRRYEESPNYTPTNLVADAQGKVTDYFFRSDARIVKNTGTKIETAAKWNIHPGMKPIKWLLSDQFLKVKDDPKLAAYDIVDAAKKGIENWNAAFGFKVLEASVATAQDSYADDDKNYIVFDADPTNQFAFANWRANPNTGEIRGASVYFNATWLTSVDAFPDDAAPGAAGAVKSPEAGAASRMSLTWGGMRMQALCMKPTTSAFLRDARDAGEAPAPGGAARRTKKELFEAYITEVINHEVGHTLGLRHNFKGSLVAPSSSVMEYSNTFDPSVGPIDKPQPYDVAAVRYLYDLSKDLPTQPFCTDGDVRTDPTCATFDVGADPLNGTDGPGYQKVLGEFLKGTSAGAPNGRLNTLLKWVKAGTPAQRSQAFTYLMSDLRVGGDLTARGFIPARVDQATANVFARMYLDAPEKRKVAGNSGGFLADAPIDATVTPILIAELRGNLVNLDKFRSFATRRIAVAVLKKMQIPAALAVLTEARKTIVAGQPAIVDASDAAETAELVSRIDAAMNGYFNF